MPDALCHHNAASRMLRLVPPLVNWLAGRVIDDEDLQLAAGYRPSVRASWFGGGGTVWNGKLSATRCPRPTMASWGQSFSPCRSMPDRKRMQHAPQQHGMTPTSVFVTPLRLIRSTLAPPSALGRHPTFCSTLADNFAVSEQVGST